MIDHHHRSVGRRPPIVGRPALSATNPRHTTSSTDRIWSIIIIDRSAIVDHRPPSVTDHRSPSSTIGKQCWTVRQAITWNNPTWLGVGRQPPAHPIGSRSSLHRAACRARSGDARDMYIAEMSSWSEYECARNRMVLDST